MCLAGKEPRWRSNNTDISRLQNLKEAFQKLSLWTLSVVCLLPHICSLRKTEDSRGWKPDLSNELEHSVTSCQDGHISKDIRFCHLSLSWDSGCSQSEVSDSFCGWFWHLEVAHHLLSFGCSSGTFHLEELQHEPLLGRKDHGAVERVWSWG